MLCVLLYLLCVREEKGERRKGREKKDKKLTEDKKRML